LYYSDSIDRRCLLKLGVNAAAAGVLGGVAAPDALALMAPRHRHHHRHGLAPWPSARLPAAAAEAIDQSQFLSRAQLKAWGAEADRLGLRATGAPDHEAYVRKLARRLARAGVKDVRLEGVPLRRWLARSWAIEADGQVLPHTFYVPYSQQTGRDGLTADLAYVPIGELLGASSPLNVAELLAGLVATLDLRGKIAVFEVPYTVLPLAAFEALSYLGDFFNPTHRNVLNPYKRPWFNELGTILELLTSAGAAATIGIWPDLPGAWARQYTPYDHVFRPIPGLWADSIGGARLRELALSGAKARIVLEASIRNVVTHNVIGFIPGASSELTVLHSHTDGTNAMEENGPIGILAGAQYMARLPRASLERTVMIMLSTGHFAGGVGIAGFLAQHAADLVPRISSILTLEHLGCLDWQPGAGGRILPTGQTEFGVYFTPDARGMIQACASAAQRNGIDTAVIRPFVPSAGLPGAKELLYWPGEGTYFWLLGGLLDGNYITGPYGLITADLDTTGMIDYTLLRHEAMTAVRTVVQLAATSSTELKPLPV
jgi:hypothetical protein